MQMRSRLGSATLSTPLDMLWQAPVMIWVVIAGEGVAAILAIAQPGQAGRWVYFGLASLAIQWVLLLTLGSLYLLRHPLSSARPLTIACAGLGMLILSSWLVFYVIAALSEALVSVEPLSRQQLFLQVTGVTLCVGLLGLAAFYNHWRSIRLALRAKQFELESLQARVRPHFLFNTLNSGIALVRQQPEKAEDLLLGLSDLFRAALARPHDLELAEELELVRRYLEIEAVRFGPRLRVAWDLPEDLPAVEVPALSIQALAENAVRHGIERIPEGGDICVGVTAETHDVVVTIRNSLATGLEHGSKGHAIGLRATQVRLQASTAGRGSLEGGCEDNQFVARMRVPKR